MIYHGTVHGGVVTFPPDVQLPDGLAVVVQPLKGATASEKNVPLEGEVRNGIHLFPSRNTDIKPDLELVNRLRDEAP